MADGIVAFLGRIEAVPFPRDKRFHLVILRKSINPFKLSHFQVLYGLLTGSAPKNCQISQLRDEPSEAFYTQELCVRY